MCRTGQFQSCQESCRRCCARAGNRAIDLGSAQVLDPHLISNSAPQAMAVARPKQLATLLATEQDRARQNDAGETPSTMKQVLFMSTSRQFSKAYSPRCARLHASRATRTFKLDHYPPVRAPRAGTVPTLLRARFREPRLARDDAIVRAELSSPPAGPTSGWDSPA